MKTTLKSIIVAVVSTAISFAASAQSEVFKVLASRGKNTLADGSPIVAGKKLQATDVVKVGENGYLGLIHNSGKTLEVKESGTYKVADLTSKVTAKSSSISQKYTSYVLNEMTKTEGGDIHANYQKNMKVTGSVERAISTASITLCLPKSFSIIEPSNTISWAKNPKASGYVVEFQNMFEDVIFTKETADTSITFDIASIRMPKDNVIRVMVKAIAINPSDDLKSEFYAIKLLQESKNVELFQEKSILEKEYKEESALNYLMKATFFAQNNLFVDAKKCYESAIRLEPSVNEYKIAYMNFLAKNSLMDFYPYEKK